MADALNLWLHIFAATLWVGPQVFLFVAVVPALRQITDTVERSRTLRVVVYRFGYLSLVAMAILIGTGVQNIFNANETYFASGPGMLEYRFGLILAAKLGMVAASIVLTGYHALVIGPRQLALSEQGGAEEELVRLRTLSVAVSGLNLLLSIGILLTAAMLATQSFSLRLR
jgi:uncharacterized membrane protein